VERYALNVWDQRFLSLTGGSLEALVSLPQEYDDGAQPVRHWPLVLFLHGRGERGSDLEAVLRHGVPPVVLRRADLPFITISPQCPADDEWIDHHNGLLELLRYATSYLSVDTQRIYLTGLSMGGRGAWRLAVEQPQLFAAVVPICGRMPDMESFLQRLPALREKPIWVFHGAKDEVAPIEDSDRIVAALRELGSHVRYTVYPEADHDSWTQAYAEEELWAWLSQQRLAERCSSCGGQSR
jgi:predicted peptidase